MSPDENSSELVLPKPQERESLTREERAIDPETELSQLVEEILALGQPPASDPIPVQKRWALAKMVDFWDEWRRKGDAYQEQSAAGLVAEVSVGYILDFNGLYYQLPDGVPVIYETPPPGYHVYDINDRRYTVHEDDFPELTQYWELSDLLDERRETLGDEGQLDYFPFVPDPDLRQRIRARALEALHLLKPN